MPDSEDNFHLGNFSGIGSESDNSDMPEQTDKETRMSTLAIRPTTDAIRHPTAKSEVQAKFRSRPDMEFLEIELDKIVPNEFQPRRTFDPIKLEELAASIRANGIIQPLVVVPKSNGQYEIIVGERRFRASKLAGLVRIPAFVKPEMNAQVKLEVALIENVQRADLNPIEQGRAYQRLMLEFKMTSKEVGTRVGKNYSTVFNLIRLLNLPTEVQQALIEGRVTEGQARPLLTLRDQNEMLEMFNIVVKNKLKSRDVEAKVREISQRKIKVREMFTPDPFITSLESLLRSKFGTRVEVNKGAKGGKIMIEFFSDEELQNILEKMK